MIFKELIQVSTRRVYNVRQSKQRRKYEYQGDKHGTGIEFGDESEKKGKVPKRLLYTMQKELKMLRKQGKV